MTISYDRAGYEISATTSETSSARVPFVVDNIFLYYSGMRKLEIGIELDKWNGYDRPGECLNRHVTWVAEMGWSS